MTDWESSGIYPLTFEFKFWLTPRAERVDCGDKVPALERLIDAMDDPGKTPRILIPQPSPTLIDFRCKRTACEPLGCESDSPARNLLVTLLVARKQGLHRHLDSLILIQKPSTGKGRLASVFLIENLLLGLTRANLRKKTHSHLFDVPKEC